MELTLGNEIGSLKKCKLTTKLKINIVETNEIPLLQRF